MLTRSRSGILANVFNEDATLLLLLFLFIKILIFFLIPRPHHKKKKYLNEITPTPASTVEAGLAPACMDTCSCVLKLQTLARRQDRTSGKVNLIFLTCNTSIRLSTWVSLSQFRWHDSNLSNQFSVASIINWI